jgi:hypothetical protein
MTSQEETISKKLEGETWVELSAAVDGGAVPAERVHHVGLERQVALGSSFLALGYASDGHVEGELDPVAGRRPDAVVQLGVGYHQFILHRSLRDRFMVQFSGRRFRYVALLFGWRLSGYWFVRLVWQFTAMLRGAMRLRVLQYVDDF